MIESPFYKEKEQRVPVLFMHLFAIFFLIAPQIVSILSIGSSVTLRGCLAFAAQITLYFICLYWVVPKMFNRRNLPVFFIRLCLLVIADILVRGMITFSRNSATGFWNFLTSFEQLVFASVALIMVLGMGFMVGLYRRNEQLRQQYIGAISTALKAETEKAKIEAIISHMRLSPHLLFNTLNYIRQKASGKVPEIEKAIDLLSGITRHSMIDVVESEKVLLSKEIAKIKDQIELHRQLADLRLYLHFTEQYEQEDPGNMIPPSTLLTFCENVFRYGLVKDPDYPATVSVVVKGRLLTFSTSNYKRRDPHHGSGLGIKSVASTLNYYYPGRHTLTVEDSEETFSLTLQIQL